MIARLLASAAAASLLAACSQDVAAPETPRFVTRAYLVPPAVDRSRQEYGPNYERFPPLMTRRTGYPTQEQAEAALRLSRWGTVPLRTLITKEGVKTISIPAEVPDGTAERVRIFACRPGALDGITGRVTKERGPVVVCSSELARSDGVVLAQVPLNFYYWRNAWRVHDPKPSYQPVPWASEEPSPPKNSWGWLPWTERY